MTRRILVALPVAILFLVTGCVFLAARAPQTWADNWTIPSTLDAHGGTGEYGAVEHGSGRWDILWVDNRTQQVLYSSENSRTLRHTAVLDAGDVGQPTLAHVGSREIAVWVRNYNGFTALRGANILRTGPSRPFTLLRSPGPLEHPYLFPGPRGMVGLVFSWQRYGNFDLFLSLFRPGAAHLGALLRLTRSQYYSFYPRAVTDATGAIDILHLESCCTQHGWNVTFSRYRANGTLVSRPQRLAAIRYVSSAQDVEQWGLDLQRDSHGGIWGAFSVATGIKLFTASAQGRITHRPVPVELDGQSPPSLAVASTSSGGYLFWQEPYDLGFYLNEVPFDRHLTLGPIERVEYLSGTQANPHASVVQGKTEVIWQEQKNGAGAGFESSLYRPTIGPDLVHRLGMGLGNPWEDAAVLALGSIALATIASAFNVIIVFVLAALAWLVATVLRRFPGRWIVCACLLTFALYYTLVVPGGPTLFLAPLPSLGLAALPFGLIAASGSLAFVTWSSYTALRRIDDLYRAAIMAFLGVYFFAFLEAAVFIEQRLGYI